jgi:hypothetical protein
MKRYIFLVVAVAVIFTGCAKDIVVTQPGELRGYYEGEFIYIENWGSGTGSQTTEQYINWTFTDQKFFCEIDTVKNVNIEFCGFSGTYVYEDKVVFSNVSKNPGVCIDDAITEGEFSLIRLRVDGAPDTLKLEQVSGGEFDKTKKTVILIDENGEE